MTLSQLAGCYLKLEEGDRVANLTTSVRYCIQAIGIAQKLNDNSIESDLKGLLGSCTFALGAETDSVNLVHEAISYHLEAASGYIAQKAYWQQQAMHLGYAAYCIETLPDSDSIPNTKRRVDLYERMLSCLPADVPLSYARDINERLSEAKRILDADHY